MTPALAMVPGLGRLLERGRILPKLVPNRMPPMAALPLQHHVHRLAAAPEPR